MEPSDNESSIIEVDGISPFREQKMSLRWPRFQGLLYLIGSCCFVSGSSMYFTTVSRAHSSVLTINGWLFTIGSSLYLWGDLQDWWKNQIRFCCDRSYHRLTNDHHSALQITSSVGSLPEEQTRTKIELNAYGATCGAILFLAGSILFIPAFEQYLTLGELFFILGSGSCSLSLLWKLYRSARVHPDNLSDRRFCLRNLLKDRSTLFMDGCSLLGNLLFFVGTIFFLPYVSRTDSDENRAVLFFVCGSACFLFSSFYLHYSLYCLSQRPINIYCWPCNKP